MASFSINGLAEHGWLGLNDNDTGLPEVLIITPVVGVGHERVQKVLAELDPRTDRRGQPLISRNLGYLTPERTYRTWTFGRDGDLDAVAADLAGALDRNGMPFIDDLSGWERFSAEIETTELLFD
ncbi:hypothetical protein ACIBQ6_07000 [Nonomuraea sp. NPDC049655]|uniref:hypothetical protein n=1 Tax=Nonomuraea sp. NPDC049655 TaxID=3364355 RepID=UPI0037A4D1AD